MLCILGRFQLIIQLSLTSLKAIASWCSPTGNQPAGKITSQITLHSLFLCIMQIIQSMNFENCAKICTNFWHFSRWKRAEKTIQNRLTCMYACMHPGSNSMAQWSALSYEEVWRRGGLQKISLQEVHFPFWEVHITMILVQPTHYWDQVWVDLTF